MDLAVRIGGHFGLEDKAELGLAKLCLYVDTAFSRRELAQFLYDGLGTLQPSDGLRLVPLMHWLAIYTVNLDKLIEDAYASISEQRVQICQPIYASRDCVGHVSSDVCLLYKLHGCISRGTSRETPLVLTDADIRNSAENRRLMFGRLQQHYVQSTPVFVGFGLADHDIMDVVDGLKRELGEDVMPRAYCVGPDFDDADREVLGSMNLVVIDATAESFFEVLQGLVRDNPRTEDPLLSLVSGDVVPDAVAGALLDLPIWARDTLLSEFKFLRDEDLDEEANTHEFYRGAPSSWGVFRERHDVRRTLLDDLLDLLLDQYADPAAPCVAVVVLGEAGAGKSTIMRRAVYELRSLLDAHVLVHQDTGSLDAEAVAALSRSAGVPLLLLIDDATPVARELASLLKQRDFGEKPIVVLAGARPNEWQDATSELALPNTSELTLGQLDRREVEDLVQLLEATGNLGALRPLSARDRCRAIEIRAEKQLLVALREATEGRSFEEIVSDEARSIPSDIARFAYLRVCASHALGCPLGIGVVQRLTGVAYVDFPEELLQPAMNVMLLRTSSPGGTYLSDGFTSRHVCVAELVMWGCLRSAEERKALYAELVEAADPGRPHEAELLKLISNSKLMDRFVDNYDARCDLYERLLRKIPDDPYVHQHYARHHLVHGHLDSAREAIDHAIKLVGDETVLLDSKARILQRLGTAASGDRLRKTYWREARELFELCRSRRPTDSYAYQGIAGLLMEQARSAPMTAERASLVAEATDILEDGIGRVKNRSMLYQQVGRLEESFGTMDAARNAFAQARKENPGDARSAYMLGRIEKRLGDLEAAAEQFETCLQLDPRHARAAFQCAECLAELGTAEVAEVVDLYRTAMSLRFEPRFLALYRLGVLFYSKGMTDEAEVTFADIGRERVENREVYRRRDELKDEDGSVVRFEGTMKHVRTRGAFIAVDLSDSDIYCDARLLPHGVGRGDRVSFSVYFNLKGPVAFDLAAG